MNNFTIDKAAKTENLNSNSILRLYKQNMMLKFMERKSNEPKLTQKQICNQLGYSDSTIKRYRDDISMDSPNKRNNYKKKTTKRKTNTNITPTQEPPKNENSKSPNKKTKNNILKGGDPNDVHMSGEELIEQAFSNSSVENYPEDNKKFITIARITADNV